MIKTILLDFLEGEANDTENRGNDSTEFSEE